LYWKCIYCCFYRDRNDAFYQVVTNGYFRACHDFDLNTQYTSLTTADPTQFATLQNSIRTTIYTDTPTDIKLLSGLTQTSNPDATSKTFSPVANDYHQYFFKPNAHIEIMLNYGLQGNATRNLLDANIPIIFFNNYGAAAAQNFPDVPYVGMGNNTHIHTYIYISLQFSIYLVHFITCTNETNFGTT
jgi:hypothetical protein